MSDNIPFEMQMEIMKKLPVKSLIQFRSVCKAWKSLIDSPDFITQYNGQHTNPQHLFLTYCDYEDKYVSIADDHTFPHHKVHLTFPEWLLEYDYDLIGCSHGLLCLSYYEDQTRIAIIWNILIRKAIAALVPNVAGGEVYKNVLGFGVCRETTDPKIVKITPIRSQSAMESVTWHAEVFTLSTGTWRSPYNGNLPRSSIEFDSYCDQVVTIDGSIYWLAADSMADVDGGFRFDYTIISFDFTREEFKEVSLPDSLAHQRYKHILSVLKLKESLVVLERVNDLAYDVWMMEDGVSKLFTKLFTINVSTRCAKVKGFRKSGEPIISFSFSINDNHNKVVYEPYSKHNDNVVIDNIFASYYLVPYMETLLLLNQPDHNEVETLKFEDDWLLEPSFSYGFNGKRITEDDYFMDYGM
ncbi:putative F-box domain-containing protein [Helianthus annuus]|nr:putative F-box domain-containing protein [Helianthus annuus]